MQPNDIEVPPYPWLKADGTYGQRLRQTPLHTLRFCRISRKFLIIVD